MYLQSLHFSYAKNAIHFYSRCQKDKKAFSEYEFIAGKESAEQLNITSQFSSLNRLS